MCVLVIPARAGAADSIYWGNWGQTNNSISFANLDGSGGGDLATLPNDAAGGLAIDSATDRIYWADIRGNKISYANLDGGGGGGLPTGAATIDRPIGVAIDPAASRIYWANAYGNKISYASLNGSGGGDLATGPATVANPNGVAIDPAAGRIYWANAYGNKISYANLNGSGGGDLATGPATVSSPAGVAVDPAAGRIYWASNGATRSRMRTWTARAVGTSSALTCRRALQSIRPRAGSTGRTGIQTASRSQTYTTQAAECSPPERRP